MAGVSSPSAVALGERRVVLLVRGAKNEVLVLERDGAGFGQPRSLGQPIARDGAERTVPVEWPIAACATGPDEIQLLARGAEGELVHGTLRGREWAGFESVGSPASSAFGIAIPMGLVSAPVACSRAPGRMDVFAVGASGTLLHSAWDGKEFSEFEAVGDESLRPPLAVANCGSSRMAVAARAPGGDMHVKWWDGKSWSSFGSIGFAIEPDPLYPAVEASLPVSSAPVAAGGGSMWLDVFARGPKGDLLRKSWNGSAWSAFKSVGRPAPAAKPEDALAFTGVSLAAVWGRFELDVFACASDGKLYGANWRAAEAIAGMF